jgi:hypothetical protein
MEDQSTYNIDEHRQFMEERKSLIDASKESSRTFDKAMLTFGSAIFGFSIAFVKDVAPQPVAGTLGWLAGSWALFSIGLLLITLSFLFSQEACDTEIDEGMKRLQNPGHKSPPNEWSVLTKRCNYYCVVAFFLGLLCWSMFAFHNIGYRAASPSGNQSNQGNK